MPAPNAPGCNASTAPPTPPPNSTHHHHHKHHEDDDDECEECKKEEESGGSSSSSSDDEEEKSSSESHRHDAEGWHLRSPKPAEHKRKSDEHSEKGSSVAGGEGAAFPQHVDTPLLDAEPLTPEGDGGRRGDGDSFDFETDRHPSDFHCAFKHDSECRGPRDDWWAQRCNENCEFETFWPTFILFFVLLVICGMCLCIWCTSRATHRYRVERARLQMRRNQQLFN